MAEDEPILIVPRECGELGKWLVVVVSTELPLVGQREEDIVISGIEEEIIVLKELIIAVVDVRTLREERKGETVEVPDTVVRVVCLAILVVEIVVGWVVDLVGKLVVFKVEELTLSVGAVILAVAVVT